MKPAYIILPLAVSAAIVSAAVISLWVIGSASGEREKFSSLEIAPQDIDILLAINTDPTSPQWLAVNDSLADINARDSLREKLDEALAEFDLEWERDILPVAGDEAYIAVPDVTKIEDSAGWLAGIRLSDTEQAREVFGKIREQQENEEPLDEQEYEGVTIYADPALSYNIEDGDIEQTSEGGSALAFVDDVLALGGSVDDVKDVIDVVQGRAETAEQNERLQDFRSHQREDFLVWGYADMENIWDLAEEGVNNFATDFGTDGGSDDGFADDFFADLGDPPEGYAGFSVLSFDAQYTTDEFGDVTAVETITVDFGATPQHGIYRDIPSEVAYDDDNDIFAGAFINSVQIDGVPAEYTEDYDFEKQREIIGDPDAQLTGTHTFVIDYWLYGPLYARETATGPGSVFQWPVTDPTWTIPSGSVTASFNGENPITGAGCVVGTEPRAVPIGQAVAPAGCSAAISNEAPGPGTSATFSAGAPVEPGSSLVIRVEASGESEAFEATPYPSDDFFEEPIEDDDEEPAGEPATPPFDTEELFNELRGTYDRVGFAFSSLNEGFALDLTVVRAEGYELEQAFEPSVAYEPELAALVPDDVMFFFSAYDIYHQNWLPARDRLDELESTGQSVDDFIQTLLDESGIDLEDDVLAQLTGEIALAGDVSSRADTTDVELYGLADVVDAADAEKTLSDFEDYLEEKGEIVASENDGIHSWETLDSEPVGLTVDDSRLIVTVPDDRIEDVIDGTVDPLSGSNDWQGAMDMLPEDKTFVAYINIARLLEEFADEQEFEDSTDGEITLGDLKPIRALGISGTAADDGFGIHFVLFMEDN